MYVVGLDMPRHVMLYESLQLHAWRSYPEYKFEISEFTNGMIYREHGSPV